MGALSAYPHNRAGYEADSGSDYQLDCTYSGLYIYSTVRPPTDVPVPRGQKARALSSKRARCLVDKPWAVSPCLRCLHGGPGREKSRPNIDAAIAKSATCTQGKVTSASRMLSSDSLVPEYQSTTDMSHPPVSGRATRAITGRSLRQRPQPSVDPSLLAI
ncbi:hypothetical protein VTK56DRAFT_2802 [Thermocarpiscus australiensis]